MLDKKRDELLYDNNWLQLIKRDDWYVFAHSKAGNGQGVMVLIYDLDDRKNPKLLGRYERTVCHLDGSHPPGKDDLNLTSITGMFDKEGKTLKEVALEEVLEEAGMVANLDELEELGFVYPSKASDAKLHLYALNGSGKAIGEIKGDGTRGEQDAFVEWMDAPYVVDNANCPMIGMTYARLLNKKY